MKKRKPGKNRKAKSAKKNRSPKPAVISQPITPALPTAEEIMARLTERNLEAVGKRIQDDLNFLPKAALLESSKSGLSDYESSVAMLWVIGGVVNRIVEMLQTIEKQTPNPVLRKVVQDQMIYAARRFSDAAFDTIDRRQGNASEVMTLSLVKFITGQCERLNKAGIENPQTFEWIAEQNVFWPSIRGLFKTYDDNFPDLAKSVNLAGKLPLNRSPEKAPDMHKAAYQEVVRFLIWNNNNGLATALPPLTREPCAMEQWRKRLYAYLDDKTNRDRIWKSGRFAYVAARAKVKRKDDNKALIWDEIRKDCAQTLETLAPPT